MKSLFCIRFCVPLLALLSLAPVAGAHDDRDEDAPTGAVW